MKENRRLLMLRYQCKSTMMERRLAMMEVESSMMLRYQCRSTHIKDVESEKEPKIEKE